MSSPPILVLGARCLPGTHATEEAGQFVFEAVQLRSSTRYYSKSDFQHVNLYAQSDEKKHGGEGYEKNMWYTKNEITAISG